MTNQRKPIIVLDPGHGGKDPGAVGHGLQEKDVVLDLGLRVGALLKARGATVLYTRGIDVFIDLSERARMANTWKADFFLSLHVNAGGNPPGSGFESFIYSGVNGGATAAYQNIIHRKIAAVFTSEGLPDRGQKKGNLAVLRETNMPAALVEYGFINNPKDAKLLADSSFLDRLAKATADGIAECFGLPAVIQEAITEGQYKMKPEDANKIIQTWLGPAWNFSQSDVDKKELHRLANELRKASGQPTA